MRSAVIAGNDVGDMGSMSSVAGSGNRAGPQSIGSGSGARGPLGRPRPRNRTRLPPWRLEKTVRCLVLRIGYGISECSSVGIDGPRASEELVGVIDPAVQHRDPNTGASEAGILDGARSDVRHSLR